MFIFTKSHECSSGGFIVLSLGSHCGKPQSQSACSPQLEEEEDHGIMYQQLYAVNLCSIQRHGKALEAYSLYVEILEAWL